MPEDVGGPEAKGGGGKKFLIIGLLGGLVVGGGGAAGAFMMMGGAGAADHGEAKVVEEDTTPKLSPLYVPMEQVSLPLINEKMRVLDYITMDLSIEVAGDVNKLKVIHRLPALKSAFLQDAHSQPIGKAGSPDVVDYPGLNERFTAVANDLLNGDVVKKVHVVRARRL